MSIVVHPGSRLLFRVEPLLGENPRGYLCCTAQAWLLQSDCARTNRRARLIWSIWFRPRCRHNQQLSYALRLEPEEWRSMCYHHVKGPSRFTQRSFCGETISADDLNYGSPRLCTVCLRERPIWWADEASWNAFSGQHPVARSSA
jgi:hypothetical protein